MTALYSDKHPKMEVLQIDLWRLVSPTKKMNMLAQLNASVRLLALTGLRMRYPQATETELHRAGELDPNYLRKWAGELKVGDLLERALKEAE